MSSIELEPNKIALDQTRAEQDWARSSSSLTRLRSIKLELNLIKLKRFEFGACLSRSITSTKNSWSLFKRQTNSFGFEILFIRWYSNNIFDINIFEWWLTKKWLCSTLLESEQTCSFSWCKSTRHSNRKFIRLLVKVIFFQV